MPPETAEPAGASGAEGAAKSDDPEEPAVDPGSAMSSTGTTISRSRSFGLEASTISHSRPAPTRNRPIRSSGRWVAERPIRCTPSGRLGRPSTSSLAWSSSGSPCFTRRSNRSRVSARCDPRFEGATAWISSTITASTPVRISRAPELIIRYSDSGVVMRMSGGVFRIERRSDWGVSPVRSATEIGAPIPASGARRFRSMS